MLALGLVWWMIASDKLDVKSVALFFKEPAMPFIQLFVWSVCVLLGALRWQLLLVGVEISISFIKTIKYQMIGLFFNTAMPGAVGGDVVKAIYIARDVDKGRGYSNSFVSILMDRIIGFASIMLFGAIVILIDFKRIMVFEKLRIVVVATLVLFVIMSIFLALVFLGPSIKSEGVIHKLLQQPGLNKLKNPLEAMARYRQVKSYFIYAMILSIVVQGLIMGLFWYLGNELGLAAIPLRDLIIIYPIGMLFTAIPLAPGGLGVGHVAFEKLFSMVGVAGGANVFNLFFVSQVILNLVGFFPFILNRVKIYPNSIIQDQS